MSDIIAFSSINLIPCFHVREQWTKHFYNTFRSGKYEIRLARILYCWNLKHSSTQSINMWEPTKNQRTSRALYSSLKTSYLSRGPSDHKKGRKGTRVLLMYCFLFLFFQFRVNPNQFKSSGNHPNQHSQCFDNYNFPWEYIGFFCMYERSHLSGWERIMSPKFITVTIAYYKAFLKSRQ